jgi:hypothetical protein
MRQSISCKLAYLCAALFPDNAAIVFTSQKLQFYSFCRTDVVKGFVTRKQRAEVEDRGGYRPICSRTAPRLRRGSTDHGQISMAVV